MGTTRIKVIDLAADVEQIKTSRKRAQTGAITKVKKPLIRQKKAQKELDKTPPQQPILGVEPLKGVAGAEETEKEVQVEKASKPKFPETRGKKYQAVKLLVDIARFYPVGEALELVKKINTAKFDSSVEAHIKVSQKGLHGFVTLPNPLGKQFKVLVFATAKDGLEGNGVTYATEATIGQIAEKKLIPKKDFNLVISTPEFMPKLASLGKILGPVGLMPNPKTGTVTEKPAETVKKFSQGSVEFKTEAENPVIHCVIGKVSQNAQALTENLLALIRAVNLQRIEKIYLTPTMGPSIKVDLTSIQ